MSNYYSEARDLTFYMIYHYYLLKEEIEELTTELMKDNKLQEDIKIINEIYQVRKNSKILQGIIGRRLGYAIKFFMAYLQKKLNYYNTLYLPAEKYLT